MSSLPSTHRVHSPRTLEEALAFLARHADEEWRPLAGGTDVMVEMERGQATAARWLDLRFLRGELSAIGRSDDGRVRVGGAATMTELRRSSLLAETFPLIAEAAATVGAVQIQNRATVAGNIANASPAGDTLPVWLVLDAEIELVSAAGTRCVPYADFTPEYRRTVRRPDELIAAVTFVPPSPERTRILFRKVGTRAAQAISKVVLAAVLRTGTDGAYEDVRLAFGSMAPVPRRAAAAERAVLGLPPGAAAGAAAAAALDADLSPVDDVRAPATYRRRVAENLVRELVAGRLGRPTITRG
ncbi:MAG TPA: FAD binding domain-containing protein [bacterium]|nr:FAD binding domain-containing protein [bacterium]